MLAQGGFPGGSIVKAKQTPVEMTTDGLFQKVTSSVEEHAARSKGKEMDH